MYLSSLDELLAVVKAHVFICPNPIPWNDFTQRLQIPQELRQELMPHILSGWYASNDFDKNKRFQAQLSYALTKMSKDALWLIFLHTCDSYSAKCPDCKSANKCRRGGGRRCKCRSCGKIFEIQDPMDWHLNLSGSRLPQDVISSMEANAIHEQKLQAVMGKSFPVLQKLAPAEKGFEQKNLYRSLSKIAKLYEYSYLLKIIRMLERWNIKSNYLSGLCDIYDIHLEYVEMCGGNADLWEYCADVLIDF